MKKAEHATEHADIEEGKSKGWIAFLLIGILLLAAIGLVWYNKYQAQKDQEENSYNGFDFALAEGGIWVTRIESGRQPYDIPFYYHPRDTLTVLKDRDATAPVFAAPQELYISVDPDAGPQVVIAGVEIAKITGTRYNLLNLNTKSALSRPLPGRVDIPVMSCQNATPDRVVLQFVQGGQNLITRSNGNDNCVILQYTDANESIRVADRYAYMLLKIMY